MSTPIATCIGCGCDDLHACVDSLLGPCSWLRVDYETGTGVCSECADEEARFDAGDRSFVP